jgi:putative tricarboxylic transport membrane protein
MLINSEFIFSTILTTFSDPMVIVMLFAGTFMGLTFGCLPGLTATVGITLLIPVTYTMDHYLAIGMMIGLYVGAMAGGAISAILLNIPGTPSAIVTTFDGYPMCQNGHGAEAMGWAAVASTVGSLVSWVALVFVSTALAAVTKSFSSPEYAALALLGLSIVGSLTSKDPIKGMTMAALGVFMTFVGIDPLYGDYRFTFGVMNLMNGVLLMPVLLGVYSIPQILQNCNEKNIVKQINVSLKNFIPSPKKIWQAKRPLAISSIVGTIIGIIPAIGSSVACFLSYDLCRRTSKDPESFGHGNYEGIIASEASNNSVCGGALVPLLTLGIPGDGVTAIILGGIMLHGVQPGAKLFTEQPQFIIGIFTCMLIATIMMFLIQLVGIKFFIKILDMPSNYMTAGLVVIAFIGSFAIRNNFFDIGTMLLFGSFAYFLVKGKYPMPPFVLGMVLGRLFENEIRITLRVSSNNWSVFFTRPIACFIIILSISFFLYSLLKQHIVEYHRRRASA